MKAIVSYKGYTEWDHNCSYEVDISLNIGRDRDEKPMPIIILKEDYWAKCYHSLEEFFEDWQVLDVERR